MTDFGELRSQNANFTFVPTMTRTDANWNGNKERISKDMLSEFLPDLHVPIYYICGSAGIVQQLKRTLLNAEVNAYNIKTEDFPGY